MRRLYALFSLLPALALTSPAPSYAQLVSITIAPPVLPVYVQPEIPAPGYIWTPGYWGYGPEGYFWVPGTWVMPPTVGLLWTPGYWGWNNGIYAWNAGYWGPTVGFYGGVNYGFGYGGVGFEGGAWRGGVFAYNRSVTNIGSVNITNVYNKTVIVNNNHVAFNGGAGGIAARPTAMEMAAAREQHIPATAAQTQHEHTASTTRENLASVNHGAPAVAATAKPGEFSGKGVVAAHGAPAAAHTGAASASLSHGPGSVPSNTGAPKAPGGAPPASATARTPAAAAPTMANRTPSTPASGAPSNPAAAAQPHPAAGAQPPHPAAAAPPRPVAAAPRAPAPAARGPAPGRPAGNHRPG
jgi:hypothetical protein